MDGRRARKIESKHKLVAAALVVVKQKGIDALTIRYLADVANVVPATVYNVFGNKSNLISEILESLIRNQSKPRIVQREQTPFEEAIQAMDRITDQWTSDDKTFTELARANGHVASFMVPRSNSLLKRQLANLQSRDVLTANTPIGTIARRITFSNAGLFDLWLHAALSKETIKREHRLNVLMPLWGFVTQPHRQEFEEAIETAAKLPRGEDRIEI